ncbi:hypothetical protein DIZ27_24570 [Streptomyces sp. NWU339]|uniref:hypothetical protein n=1 Tax=Streptomyces sp. NWU339 TaxID=2185284 RepID=UPI000D682DE8|nr:hypothetical protein [Streptomyces sp. NWU339]PWI08099.1 hypothetical protein DIZ27_24570 [Streptomyces sp. NWU339]
MSNQDVRNLLQAGIGEEPPVRTTVDAVVAAGRRVRTRRRLALTGAGVTAAAAAVVLAVVAPGAGPEASVSAADPLVPAGVGTDEAGPLRPDSFGPGIEHTVRWSGKRLADNLVALLPQGRTTTQDGDIKGRTFRVTWDNGDGEVTFTGSVGYTAKESHVPFCAKIAVPKITPRPGMPAPEDVAPREDCETVELADGARAESVTLRFPATGSESQYVRVKRTDGRTVALQQWTDQPTKQPPLDADALLDIANSPTWRF